MKIKELISELSKFDEDLEVKMEYDNYYYNSIDSIQKAESMNWIILREC